MVAVGDTVTTYDAATGAAVDRVAVDGELAGVAAPTGDAVIATSVALALRDAGATAITPVPDLARVEARPEAVVVVTGARLQAYDRAALAAGDAAPIADVGISPAVAAGAPFAVDDAGARIVTTDGPELRVWDVATVHRPAAVPLVEARCDRIALAASGAAAIASGRDAVTIAADGVASRATLDASAVAVAWAADRPLWVTRAGLAWGDAVTPVAGEIVDVALAPDRATAYVATRDAVVAYGLAADRPRELGRASGGAVRVAVSRDGAAVYVARRDGAVDRLAMDLGTSRRVVQGEAARADVVDLDATGDGVVVASRGAAPRLVRDDGAATALGDDGAVAHVVAVTADGAIVTGGLDGTLRRFTRDGRPDGVLDLAADIEDVGDARGYVIAGAADGTLTLWAPDGGEHVRLDGGGPVEWIAATADLQRVVACGPGGAIAWPLGEPLGPDAARFDAWLDAAGAWQLDDLARPFLAVERVP
ncbi:MAG: hypothetical protein H6708_22050 [Kofleriaceae bacterium]|nr:hypothetical protein [Kofleriaceae bacterium]